MVEKEEDVRAKRSWGGGDRFGAEVGGLYVIPIALCRPVISNLVGIKAIVASPGLPPAIRGGIKNLIIDSGFLSE